MDTWDHHGEVIRRENTETVRKVRKYFFVRKATPRTAIHMTAARAVMWWVSMTPLRRRVVTTTFCL